MIEPDRALVVTLPGMVDTTIEDALGGFSLGYSVRWTHGREDAWIAVGIEWRESQGWRSSEPKVARR
jgi:hypothetical protein